MRTHQDKDTHTTILIIEPQDEVYIRLKQLLKDKPDTDVVWVVTPHQNPNWQIKWFMTADKCAYHIINNDNLRFRLVRVVPR